MYSLLMAAALAATNTTVYRVSPTQAVLSEERGQLVSTEYVAGEFIMAFIPERIFFHGFE